jgi:Zn-dependent protease with chaperone function
VCRLLLAAAAGSAATMLLSLLAWTLIARLPLVAAVGAWSGDDRHHNDPVPAPAAKASCVILALEAFAIPTGDEHHGRIVVSSGMLRTLTPEGRSACGDPAV